MCVFFLGTYHHDSEFYFSKFCCFFSPPSTMYSEFMDCKCFWIPKFRTNACRDQILHVLIKAQNDHYDSPTTFPGCLSRGVREDDKEGRVHPQTISVQPPEEQSL